MWQKIVHMLLYIYLWRYDWMKSENPCVSDTDYLSSSVECKSSSFAIFSYSMREWKVTPLLPALTCSVWSLLWWFCVWHHYLIIADWKTQGELLHLLLLTPPPIIITSSLTMMDGCDWKVSLAQESPVVIAVLWHLINHHAIIQPTRDLDPGHVSIISQSEQCCS